MKRFFEMLFGIIGIAIGGFLLSYGIFSMIFHGISSSRESVNYNISESYSNNEQYQSGNSSASAIKKATQSNGKWKMTFLDCKAYKSIDNLIYPADGNEFVVTFFELENRTNEKQIFSYMYMSAYFDDYKVPISLSTFAQIENAIMMATLTVEPKKKIKGYLVYEVKSNWKKLDMVYDEDIFSTTNLKPLRFTLDKYSS